MCYPRLEGSLNRNLLIRSELEPDASPSSIGAQSFAPLQHSLAVITQPLSRRYS
jgi:hypothetical protein